MNILSIDKNKREAVIKFDCSELVALCNAIFHETEVKEEKVNPIIWRLDYGITVASNLSQYGHIDSFALGRMNQAYEKINGDSREDSTGGSSVPTSYTAYVTSSNGKGVNLRKGPSTGYGSYGTYDVGTKITVLSQAGDWSYIDVNGRKGYMMSKYITTSKPDTNSRDPQQCLSHLR